MMKIQRRTSREFLYKLSLLSITVFLLSLVFTYAPKVSYAVTPPTGSATSWWPTNGATVSGIQPFKGVVSGWNIADYTMEWTVDNGTPSSMNNDYNGYPHKEAQVNVQGWNWHADGKYTITYIAKTNSGRELTRASFVILVPPSGVATSTTQDTLKVTTPSVGITPTPLREAQTVSKPLAGLPLYVDPDSHARQQADSWRQSRPADASAMDKIATQSQAQWLGGWNSNIQSDVAKYVGAANDANAVPTLVAYNIPQRDCGGYSAGGASIDGYVGWIKAFAAGIGNQRAIVILEPDALAGIDCLSSSDQLTRYSLLSQAVSLLKAGTQTRVYIDAGHSGWKTPADMAKRLSNASISTADGFTLNVSNFISTPTNVTYGQAISALINNKHFVIDTSRNGETDVALESSQWCNQDGRGLGFLPTTSVSNPLIDAYLWIKAPGESDGTCNGGPSAGNWWPEYALGLAQRSKF